MRATIRALIVANEYLESEVGELMKAVSHAMRAAGFTAIQAETPEGCGSPKGRPGTRPMPRPIFLYDGLLAASPHVTLRVEDPTPSLKITSPSKRACSNEF